MKPKPVRVRQNYHAMVEKRDGRVCIAGLFLQDGCEGPIDKHHIQKRSQLGSDVLENLISLCRKHHMLAERREITPEQLKGYLQRLYGG